MVVISEDVLEQILMKPEPPFTGHRGAIIRIKLKNFMTYHSAELVAGPHVNLILGPNGTGKSSILNAICLGLNGKTKILARMNSLKSFIQRNCTSASIEIELFNPSGPNHVIKRSFKESGGNDWYHNGRHVQAAAIDSLLKSLNIQLDNLCQFLPQERVEEFSKMDSYSLLVSTEKAIANDVLYNLHQDLIELQAKIEGSKNQLGLSTADMEAQLKYVKSMEKQVQCFKERENIKAKIDELSTIKAWIIYVEAVNFFSDVKNRLKEVKDNKKKEENSISPLKKILSVLDTKLNKLRQDMNRTRSDNTTKMNSVKRIFDEGSHAISNKILVVQDNLEAKEQIEKDRISRYQNALQRVSAVQHEFNTRGKLDETTIQSQIRDLEHENIKLSNDIFEERSVIEQNNAEKTELTAQIRYAENELRKLDVCRNARMSFLYRLNKDVHRAVEYFEKTENLSGFKGRLYEPMLLHINVKDNRYGKILEKHVSMNHMCAFMCDNESDMATLAAKYKELGVRVSTVFHNPGGSGLPPPVYSDEFLRRFAFQTVLINCLEGPVYYLTYLCKKYSVHYVPIGDRETDKVSDRITRDTKISTYYTETSQYKINKSHYSNNKNTSVNHLRNARVFTDQINLTERVGLKYKLNDLTSKLQKADVGMSDRHAKKDALTAQRKEKEAQIKALQTKIQYYRNLENKLATAQRSAQIYQKPEVDLVEEREKSKQQINEYNLESEGIMRKLTEQTNEIAKISVNILIYKRQLTAAQAGIISCQNSMEDSDEKIAVYTAQLKKMESEVNDAANAAERLKKAAHALSPSSPKPLKDVNLTDIEKDLHTATVQLGLLAETDPKVMAEYSRKMKRVEELKRVIESQELEKADLQANLDTKKEAWLTPLTELMGKVNKNFGKLFSYMKCAGQVELMVPENPLLFKEYGVKIRIKFRDAEPLAELTGYKQSGGERAITTALYILALQELTTVPFRVLDEINQGMDARNEALFFNVLSELANGPRTPQYFLLTPKMLPTVEFSENIHFHVIFNGPHVNVPIIEMEKYPKKGSSRSDRSKLEESPRKRRGQ